MRTKTTLLTAALVAAGAATSMAQVYSLNVVGYINVTLTNGFQMIACPLQGSSGNAIKNILTSVPDNTSIYKFNGVGYDQDLFFSGAGGWVNGGNITLNPGEGAFVQLPGGVGASANVTFVGTVVQGQTTTTVNNGFNIVSSQAPLSGNTVGTGGVTTALKYNPKDLDSIYIFNPATQSYDQYLYFAAAGGWQPSEPIITSPSTAFFLQSTGGSWQNNFTVQ